MAAGELKSSDYDALAKIAAFEETMDESKKALGWSWQDVAVYPATIQKLMLNSLVELRYSSNRYKNYRLLPKARDMLAMLASGETEQPAIHIDVADLFAEVVGYDDLKELLTEVLLAEDPIHVLLYGPPSVAKSMFLTDIERVTGSATLMLLGSSTSHSGMWDLITERHPRFILIDELEKMQLADMAGLLSLMENQRIIRAKVGRMLEEKIDARVIAAANVIRKLPPELLSRFWKYGLQEYGASEFVQVVKSVLVKRESIGESDAHNIATKLIGKATDVRDAVRVARLSKRVGVDRALQLYFK